MMPRIQVVRIGAKLGVGNLRSFVIPVTAAFEQAWSVGQALFADDARRVEQTAGWPACHRDDSWGMDRPRGRRLERRSRYATVGSE